MVIAFFNNQTMVATPAAPCVIFTDPVALNGNDRAACMSNVHNIFVTGAGAIRLVYVGQVSNDGGANFTDVTLCADTLTAAGVRRVVATTVGALLRFKATLEWSAGGAAGDIASCCFDLHVNLDHA